ncbi:MAG: type I restriction enzyme HsdR N-terminal domain-containing protein [Bacteroidia bacterium]
MFPDLNLPTFPARIEKNGDEHRIFDIIRKKFILLTPEEWVRQHFLNFLITEKKYPASLISVERGHKLNTLQNRTDILVYNKYGQPWLLVECKAPAILLSEETLHQALRYNLTLNVNYLVVTNGFEHYCCKQSDKEFVFIDDLPEWNKG